MATLYFPEVTLLVTHYNRSKSLERLLQAFQDLKCEFEVIVVSDDSSQPQHLQALEQLQQRFVFDLVTTPVNKGLGNNLNKGQDAVHTPYTLYVQEDFVPTPAFLPAFQYSLVTMQEHPDVDIMRYYAYYAYPYLRPYGGGFSEVICKPWYLNTSKIYSYTDHPHLRRSNFLQKFDRYVEGIKSDKTEYLMCISFIRNHGKALFYNDFKSLFIQENSSEEPSTVTRSNWRQGNGLLMGALRGVYRQVKFNYDLYVA